MLIAAGLQIGVFLFLIPSVLIQPLNKGQDYMQITAYHLRGLCMVWRRVLKSLKTQVLLSSLVGLWGKKKKKGTGNLSSEMRKN